MTVLRATVKFVTRKGVRSSLKALAKDAYRLEQKKIQ